MADASRTEEMPTMSHRVELTGAEEETTETGRDRDKLATQLSIGLVVLGFIIMFLGWYGASGKNAVQQQIPYLLSGGLPGLALVFIGGGILIVRDVRRERDALETHLTQLAGSVEEAMQVISRAPRAAAPVAGHTVNGAAVVLGRTVYHRPDCRLVQGKSDLTLVSRDEAEDEGLNPCRTCEP